MSDQVNPTDYGVLYTGFSRMRMPEIRQQIIDTLNATLGITLETRPDSITGQFIDTFAEREATLWELAEAVYFAMYPISAYGINLDNAVSFAGVRRFFAQTSYAWVACYGQELTPIPAGSVIRNATTQDEFVTRNDITITKQACADITFEVLTANVGETYWAQADETLCTYVCQAGDTTVTIAAHLAQQLLSTSLQQSIDANYVRLWTVESVAFDFQCSTNIMVAILSSMVFVDALATGPLDVSAGNLTQIVSMMDGWDSVNNIVSGFTGRNVETDDELRLRYNTGVYRLGAATLPSIKANLEQNIPGILNVEVFENENDVADSEGRKPHSIEVVAYGGDAQQIGDAIFALKAAGIDTNGSVHVVVTDTSNHTHDIYFNRPLPVYFFVKVTVSLYDEEIFPDNGVQQIQTIIAATGNSFGIGKDVILQRFYGPIYNGVSGIGRLDIAVASTFDPNYIPVSGDYVTTNVPISSRQLAQFSYPNVFVTVNP